MAFMSNVDALNERIDALEMRLTYQDVTIETLNQTITAQWVEIDRLTRQVAELKERGLAVGAIETQPGLFGKAEVTDPEGNKISFGQALSPGND